MQSALTPRGPAAEQIASIAWVLFIGGGALFVLVMALAAWALWVRPERRAWLAQKAFVVVSGIVLPVVLLSALLAYVFASGALTHRTDEPAALRIEVTGEQWWWRVRYLDASGHADFDTANEIRIPAGQSVELSLASADVIHSFWVPSLAGKVDMVPGRSNRLRLIAGAPGVFRGQCAEYCGGPHAQMALYVVAEGPERFAAWREAQKRPAKGSSSLFLARCAVCHTVRGTQAAGRRGPDLTHFASRRSIGAGVLPNTQSAVADWIVASQHLKPGNLMPEFRDLEAEELRALAAYLASLE